MKKMAKARCPYCLEVVEAADAMERMVEHVLESHQGHLRGDFLAEGKGRMQRCQCGAPIEKPMLVCSKCGAPLLPQYAKFLIERMPA